MRLVKIMGALAMFSSPVIWADGLLCTMPNGVTITQRTGECPRDARRVTTLAGQVVRDQPLPALPSQAPPPRQKSTPGQAQRKTEAPKEREIVNEAYGVCALLKAVGATSCEVNVNVFSASFIDATVPTTPADARGACQQIVKMTRQQPGSPFMGRGWELRLFSPMGSGARPIAVCVL